MQFGYFAYLALDLTRERILEAEARYRYAEELGHAEGPGVARRSLARVAAGVSRVSASVARRLDSGALETVS
jgi:hypothetical protein